MSAIIGGGMAVTVRRRRMRVISLICMFVSTALITAVVVNVAVVPVGCWWWRCEQIQYVRRAFAVAVNMDTRYLVAYAFIW